MIERRSQLDKIIITAMDRFVWFVLLVVMSHLVTEFTRVTGYARGQRNEIVLVNDSLLQPMAVQNMLLYPVQEHSAMLNAPNTPNGNSIQQNAALFLNSLGAGVSNAGNNVASSNVESGYPMFSFRPLIDSIFEIPISTLRAVNNLVARLTGSYRQVPSATDTVELGQKSVNAAKVTDTQLRLPRSAGAHSNVNSRDFKLSTTAMAQNEAAPRKVLPGMPQMREELA